MVWLYNMLFLVVLAVAIGFGQGSDEWYRCPSGLTRNSHLRTYNGKCYEFVNHETKWHLAQQSCRRHSGKLVNLLNRNTHNYIYNSLLTLGWDKNGVWLGANDREEEYNWVWDNGPRVSWGYWGSNQPSCGFLCIEDCAVMRLDDGGKWHDYACNSPGFDYSYICEYDMKPATTTKKATTTTTTTTTTAAPTLKPTTPRTTETTTATVNVTRPFPGGRTTTRFRERVEKFQDGEEKMAASTGGMDTGTLTGIIIGALAAVCLVGVVIFIFMCTRRRRKFHEDLEPGYLNPTYADRTSSTTHASENIANWERVSHEVNVKTTTMGLDEEGAVGGVGVTPKGKGFVALPDIPYRKYKDSKDFDNSPPLPVKSKHLMGSDDDGLAYASIDDDVFPKTMTDESDLDDDLEFDQKKIYEDIEDMDGLNIRRQRGDNMAAEGDHAANGDYKNENVYVAM